MYQKKEGSFIKHLDFMILDLVMIEFSYWLACTIRHNWKLMFSEPKYLVMGGVLILLDLLVTLFYSSYQNILRRGYLIELKNVIFQNTIILLLIFAFLFLTKQQMFFSRLVFIELWVISIVLTYGARLTWKRIIRKKLRNSEERAHLLVISEADKLEEIIRQLLEVRYESYRIVGAVAYDKPMKGAVLSGVPVVADWDQMFEYVTKEVIDEVLLHLNIDEKIQKVIIDRFLEMGVTVHINLDLSAGRLPNALIQSMGKCSVLTTSIKTATIYQMFMKRLLDIAGSIVGLVATAILFLFLAPVIYIQSPGPIFFSQMRVGKNGRRFRIYKFRTMYMDAEERKKELMNQNKMNGLMFKMDDDPRIFPAGKLIRKLSLDEFPQFWNVLKGDMSLVGTRPPTVDEFEQYDPHHKVRLAIKPGLTGMWQVSGRSDITDFEEVVKLDNQYIAEWNLRLDLKIILRTVGVVLGRQGSV